MNTFVIRQFRRTDREQVTGLVNAHIAAVLPGCAVPVKTVLNQFEREPGEFIVDPWVAERKVLVAEQSGAIVAAALLHRYADRTDVGPQLRGAGGVRWLVFWPSAPRGNPHWNDGQEAADSLLLSSLQQLAEWSCLTCFADGSLPAPGIYGVPEQWPHVDALYRRNGFAPLRTETVFGAHLSNVPTSSPLAPIQGLDLRRTVGINGTRFSAVLDGRRCAYIEVERLDQPERNIGPALSDIGNLWIDDEFQRRGVGTWLLGAAMNWLKDGGAHILLSYCAPEESGTIAFLRRNGFDTMTTTGCQWVKTTPKVEAA